MATTTYIPKIPKGIPPFYSHLHTTPTDITQIQYHHQVVEIFCGPMKIKLFNKHMAYQMRRQVGNYVHNIKEDMISITISK